MAHGGVTAGIFKIALPRQFPAFCCVVFALRAVTSLFWQRVLSLLFLGSLFILPPSLVSEGLQLVFLGCLGVNSTGAFLLPQRGAGPAPVKADPGEKTVGAEPLPFVAALGLPF